MKTEEEIKERLAYMKAYCDGYGEAIDGDINDFRYNEIYGEIKSLEWVLGESEEE